MNSESTNGHGVRAAARRLAMEQSKVADLPAVDRLNRLREFIVKQAVSYDSGRDSFLDGLSSHFPACYAVRAQTQGVDPTDTRALSKALINRFATLDVQSQESIRQELQKAGVIPPPPPDTPPPPVSELMDALAVQFSGLEERARKSFREEMEKRGLSLPPPPPTPVPLPAELLKALVDQFFVLDESTQNSLRKILIESGLVLPAPPAPVLTPPELLKALEDQFSGLDETTQNVLRKTMEKFLPPPPPPAPPPPPRVWTAAELAKQLVVEFSKNSDPAKELLRRDLQDGGVIPPPPSPQQYSASELAKLLGEQFGRLDVAGQEFIRRDLAWLLPKPVELGPVVGLSMETVRQILSDYVKPAGTTFLARGLELLALMADKLLALEQRWIKVYGETITATVLGDITYPSLEKADIEKYLGMGDSDEQRSDLKERITAQLDSLHGRIVYMMFAMEATFRNYARIHSPDQIERTVFSRGGTRNDFNQFWMHYIDLLGGRGQENLVRKIERMYQDNLIRTLQSPPGSL